MVVRFIHGFIGGMLVGTGFFLMARTIQPYRTFGVLLFVPLGFGGLGIMFIAGLVPEFGTQVLFYSLVAFSVATFIMLPFLSGYELEIVGVKSGNITANSGQARRSPAIQ